MKANYWHAERAFSVPISLIAVLSVAGIVAVESLPVERADPNVREKLAAARLAGQAMDEVKAIRLEMDIAIDPSVDPSQSGLIGCLASPVTSNNGHLPAKQTTVNPNFAAAIVSMLKEAGVEPGGVVAIGFSGSFPALNICVLSALETLEVRPLIISSMSASQWGANHPQLLWIDMERSLYDRGVFRHRSLAASVGGIEDRGVGLPPEGLKMLHAAIDAEGLTKIDPENYLDSVNQRMALYHRHAEGAPIKAYINVGGGTTSVGTKKGKALFAPGLNRHKPPGALPVDSVMARFADQGVPVIHLSNIDRLAVRYGLPRQPAVMPRVGEGQIYSPRSYNKLLAGGLLGVIVVGLYVLGRTNRSIPSADIAAWREHSTSSPRDNEELL